MNLKEGEKRTHEGIGPRPHSTWKITRGAVEFLPQINSETLFLRIIAWTFLLSSVMFMSIFLRQEIRADQVWIMHIKGYAIYVAMHFVLFYLYRRLNNHINLGVPLKSLATRVPREDAEPIRLTIKHSGVITGFDEGYLWFDEGTLFYKGRQTVFRLNSRDFEPLKLWRRKDRPQLGKRIPWVLPLNTEYGKMRVEFHIIDAHEDYTTRRKAAIFNRDLTKWFHDRPEGSLESLLPPCSLHLALKRSGMGRIEPLLTAGFLSALNISMFLLITRGYEMNEPQRAWAGFGALVFAVMLLFSLQMAFQCFRTNDVRSHLLSLED